VGLTEGLQRTLAWFREALPAPGAAPAQAAGATRSPEA
jgi:hypothetical protein